MSMDKLCSFTVMGLLLWTMAASAQEAIRPPAATTVPVTEQDIVTLVRAQQLQDWLQQPVPLAVSVCIEERYRSGWPSGGTESPTDRQENALRMVHEACKATLSDETDPARFVTAGKAQFLERVARLQGVSRALAGCQSATQPTEQVNACAQRVVGRNLSEHERRALLPEKMPPLYTR